MKMQADAADKQSRAQNDHMRLQIEAAKLKLEEARVTGVMENQAEANDIKRDIAAAEDDRARELEMAAIGVQQAQAIAAIQPNPVIDNG